MAAQIANRINAKCLILNHFSQRYKPLSFINGSKAESQYDDSSQEDDSVQKLIEEAKIVFKNEVIAAFDLFTHKV